MKSSSLEALYILPPQPQLWYEAGAKIKYALFKTSKSGNPPACCQQPFGTYGDLVDRFAQARMFQFSTG